MLTVGLCSIIKKIIFELGLKEPVRFGHSAALAGSVLSPTNKRPDEEPSGRPCFSTFPASVSHLERIFFKSVLASAPRYFDSINLR